MKSYQPPKQTGTFDSTTSSAAEVVAEAGNFALDRVEEFQENVNNGSCSLRFLAYTGALAIIAVSIYGLCQHLVLGHWLAAIFDVYMFCIAIGIIVLEYGRQMKSFLAYEESLYRNALFLKYVWGRGLFYCVVGSLEMHQMGFGDIIVGAWMCFVGLFFIWWGKKSGQTELSASRREEEPKERRVRRLNILL